MIQPETFVSWLSEKFDDEAEENVKITCEEAEGDSVMLYYCNVILNDHDVKIIAICHRCSEHDVIPYYRTTPLKQNTNHMALDGILKWEKDFDNGQNHGNFDMVIGNGNC